MLLNKPVLFKTTKIMQADINLNSFWKNINIGYKFNWKISQTPDNVLFSSTALNDDKIM